MIEAIAPLQVIPPDLAARLSQGLPIAAAVLGAYVIAFLLVSALARAELTDELADYTVASRNLGWVVTTFTIFATIFSGVGMAGFPGTIYVVGGPFVSTIVLGFAVTAPLIWYLGRRMWLLGGEYGFETPGDLLGTYYDSDLVRIYSVIASVFFNIAYIVAQVLAGGILLTVLTGGTVPFNVGMVIVAAIVMLHVTVTGIRGIAYLDTVNGAVIVTLLGAFGIFIALDAGGLANVFGGLSGSLGPAAGSHYSIPGTVGAFSAEVVVLFGILFTLGTAFASPATWIRMYALDKERNFAKIAAGMLLAMIVAHVWGTNLIGTYGHTLFPFAGPGQPGTNPDFVSSLAAFEALPFAVAVLFLVAVFAAVVSTTDSYMHVMSATVVRDFYKAVVDPDMDEQSELQANYVVMALTAVAGLVGAFLYPGLITPLAIVAGGFTIQLLPLLIGAVAWPRASTEAAIAAPVVGTVLLVVFQLGLLPNPFPVPNVPGLVVSFLANVVVFVGVSYLTQPVSMERIEQFHGTIARNFSTSRVEPDTGPGPAPADD